VRRPRSGSRAMDPALRPRHLDRQGQSSRDIKVGSGGSSPLAPTRTSVRRFRAYRWDKRPWCGGAISPRRTPVSPDWRHFRFLTSASWLVTVANPCGARSAHRPSTRARRPLPSGDRGACPGRQWVASRVDLDVTAWRSARSSRRRCSHIARRARGSPHPHRSAFPRRWPTGAPDRPRPGDRWARAGRRSSRPR
jgi:hypothetical protein